MIMKNIIYTLGLLSTVAFAGEPADPEAAARNGYPVEEPIIPTKPTKHYKPTKHSRRHHYDNKTKTVTKVIDNTTRCVKYYPDPKNTTITCTETEIVKPTVAPTVAPHVAPVDTPCVTECKTVTVTKPAEQRCTTIIVCNPLNEGCEKSGDDLIKSVKGKVTYDSRGEIRQEDREENRERRQVNLDEDREGVQVDREGRRIEINLDEDENQNSANVVGGAMTGLFGAVVAALMFI